MLSGVSVKGPDVESWNPVIKVAAADVPRSPTTLVDVPWLVTPAPLPAPKVAAVPKATDVAVLVDWTKGGSGVGGGATGSSSFPQPATKADSAKASSHAGGLKLLWNKFM